MPGFGRGGMLPGLGRLPPGRGPAAGRSPPERSPPGRSAPGRGPRSPPEGRSPPGRGGVGRGAGAPEPTPNGLLPTRGVRGPGFGPPGLGPCGLGGTTDGVPDCAGFAGPGFGPGGLGVGDVGDVGGFGPALAAGTSWVRGACGPGRGPGRGPGTPDGRGLSWVVSGVLGGAGTAPFFDGAGPGIGLRPPDLPPGLPSLAENASRNRRATGASTVDDADFTNSPCSFSLARTSLLVTPSSLASSCTRALPATALLN